MASSYITTCHFLQHIRPFWRVLENGVVIILQIKNHITQSSNILCQSNYQAFFHNMKLNTWMLKDNVFLCTRMFNNNLQSTSSSLQYWTTQHEHNKDKTKIKYQKIKIIMIYAKNIYEWKPSNWEKNLN